MSLIRSLNSGVSGLRSFQTKMDVIGNNIANVETAGYKSSRVTFAEMMNQRMGRQGGNGDSAPQLNNEVGLGVRVASIDRDFTQGTMNTTGIETDLAIDGSGFFMVSSGGENLMTRAGNFVFNKDGFLVDQAGRSVQGYNADHSGNIMRGAATNAIRIDYDNALPPQQTENVTLAGNLAADTSTTRVIQSNSALTIVGGGFASRDTDLNDLNQMTTDLDDGDGLVFTIRNNEGVSNPHTFTYAAGATVGDLVDWLNSELGAEGSIALVDGMLTIRSSQMGESELGIDNVSVTGSGSMNMPSFTVSQEGVTNTRTTSTTVYDDLGRAHTLVVDFSQVAESEWQYSARFMDGEQITSGESGTVTFDELGQLTSDDSFTINYEPGNGAGSAVFEMQLGDTSRGSQFTQYAGTNSAKIVGQDGYTQGALVDVTIDGAGQIEGIYDNGKSRILSQIALATVQNELGLEMIGEGLYRATSTAGEVFVNDASSMAETSISSGTLESSNVDLAREFTEMITSQRAYQSNARVITTSDEMLMEAVNLKR